jgi:hypothetical protein
LGGFFMRIQRRQHVTLEVKIQGLAFCKKGAGFARKSKKETQENL